MRVGVVADQVIARLPRPPIVMRIADREDDRAVEYFRTERDVFAWYKRRVVGHGWRIGARTVFGEDQSMRFERVLVVTGQIVAEEDRAVFGVHQRHVDIGR